jgi:hypothetical protein
VARGKGWGGFASEVNKEIRGPNRTPGHL